METRSRFHLTIPVLITTESDIDLAISIFNGWCAKRESIKQYGYKRSEPQVAEFFLTTEHAVQAYLIRSIISRLEHVSCLIYLSPIITSVK